MMLAGQSAAVRDENPRAATKPPAWSRPAGIGLTLPAWVADFVGCKRPKLIARRASHSLEVRPGEHRALITAIVPGAARLEALDLQRRTLEAYLDIGEALSELPARHPVRFWNFVPEIHAPAGDGLNRYMVFNAGRFAAYLQWYGRVSAFDRHVPTATGIGHDADDLVIHALAADRPGVHIMNPRQRRPRRYSRGYGPFPPCFARATLLPSVDRAGVLVLIGGTAAVSGERSVYARDLHGQTEETLRNLARVVRGAASAYRELFGRAPQSDPDPCRWVRSLRVYVADSGDARVVADLLARRFGHLPAIEFLRADVCRPELLVEIEGTAEISDGAP